MASLSLFPLFLDPLGGSGTGGGDGLIVELMAEPDIVLTLENINVSLDTDTVSVEVEEDITIEVE
jgi:hypothetical protein